MTRPAGLDDARAAAAALVAPDLRLIGTHTTPWVERTIACILGVDEAVADQLVEAVRDAGLLAHGVAVPLLVAAARSGTDHAHAARAIVQADRSLPDSWSDYEARTATDEALGIVRGRLARGRIAATHVPPRRPGEAFRNRAGTSGPTVDLAAACRVALAAAGADPLPSATPDVESEDLAAILVDEQVARAVGVTTSTSRLVSVAAATTRDDLLDTVVAVLERWHAERPSRPAPSTVAVAPDHLDPLARSIIT